MTGKGGKQRKEQGSRFTTLDLLSHALWLMLTHPLHEETCTLGEENHVGWEAGEGEDCKWKETPVYISFVFVSFPFICNRKQTKKSCR